LTDYAIIAICCQTTSLLSLRKCDRDDPKQMRALLFAVRQHPRALAKIQLRFAPGIHLLRRLRLAQPSRPIALFNRCDVT